MHAALRRQAILDVLRQSGGPVSASALAERFSVSRQIIVGDVALLRAAAAKAGICDITQRGTQLVFSFGPQPDITAVAAVCGMASYRQRLQLSAAAQPKLTLYLQPKEEALSAAGKLVEELALQHEDPA